MKTNQMDNKLIKLKHMQYQDENIHSKNECFDH